MKIALLTKSISRKAGGLLEAIRVPIEHFDDSKLDLRVFAVSDDYSEEDMKVWGKINVSHFPAVGPTAFGYSPEMKGALESFSPDLIHIHGLFYYTSVLATQWATKNKCPYVISPHGMLDKWALKNSQ